MDDELEQDIVWTDGHNAYPHEPGRLYDCEVCESQCFCVDNQCVFCALSEEKS